MKLTETAMTLRMEKSLKEEAKKVAEKEKRSLNNLINVAVQEYINKK